MPVSPVTMAVTTCTNTRNRLTVLIN